MYFQKHVSVETRSSSPNRVSYCDLPTSVNLKVEILNNKVMPEDVAQESTDAVSKCSSVEFLNNSVSQEAIVIANCENVTRRQSFPIPNALAMDPLAQTALTVHTDFMDRIGSSLSLLRDHGKKVQKYVWKNRRLDSNKKTNKSIVNVVLVEAKDLPEFPDSGSNVLYCKFKLGNESHKSKQAAKSKPSWCEQFKMNLYDDSGLEVTLWHKGKQKNFMGRCTIDLSSLKKEKTHDLWQQLECGYGALHLLVTLNPSARPMVIDNIPTNGVHPPKPKEDNFTWYSLTDYNWSTVGKLHVTVRSAKGLAPSVPSIGTESSTFAVLELDNSRVQTSHAAASTPVWDKNFTLDVTDVTSTLELSVYHRTPLYTELLGRVSIPLLRIYNGEDKWYALKDKSNKTNAKGNVPRILLHMNLMWNPIKASVRVLAPKEVKYTQKKPKFNIPLVYSNLKFIGDIFQAIEYGNNQFKLLFEWDNQEASFLTLTAWLSFWFFCRPWMIPVLLVIPFIYHWVGRSPSRDESRTQIEPSSYTNTSVGYKVDEDSDEGYKEKDDKTLKMRIASLQDLTFTIKDGIDYIVTLVEKIKNLFKFAVPYLSYLAVLALLAAALALYLIPANYLFMAFGVYKFTRKILRPDREPNNDILDFLSRVPNNETLKQWKELKVPEPNVVRSVTLKRRVLP